MSQKKPFDYLVMIGDYAPFHFGCERMLQDALEIADQVIILINNSHIPRNIENPWSYEERYDMIAQSAYSVGEHSNGSRVRIAPLFNYLYDTNMWIAQVQEIVNHVVVGDNPVVGIYSNDKKLTDKFPQWMPVETTIISHREEAGIRQIMFEYKSIEGLTGFFSPQLHTLLNNFIQTKAFKDLVDEFEFIKKYKKAWESAPYAPTFCTSDVVVVQSGHVLMVVRGGYPGHNQLALPGGFLEQNETFQEGALRELIEETKIDVPLKVLRGSIKDSHVFDAPNRSLRGRTVTQAFYIELPDGPLPKVKGSDDAKKAIFVPFDAIDSNNIFEDHFSVIRYWIK